MKKSLVIVSVCAFFFSCQGKKDNEKNIARVGGSFITESYLEEKIAELGPEANKFLSSAPGRKQFLDMLVNEKLVKMASESSPLKNSKEYRERVEEMRKESENRLKEYREYLLTRMFMEDLKKKELEVTQAEIKDYAAAHPKMVSLEHIVADNYEKAEEILKRIKSGTSFSKIAEDKKYEGTVAGGKLPPILPGEFLPELEDMITKMKVGEIQGVVASKMGFHIIKKNAESALDLSKIENSERVRKVLEKRKFDEYIAKLQKKYKVEVLDERYK
ncbi:MAG: hypothetical protein GX447_06700 [Elusimicrobia bacterium]|nr:hypothetical protein [Elusimicrobiota bacterium]